MKEKPHVVACSGCGGGNLIVKGQFISKKYGLMENLVCVDCKQFTTANKKEEPDVQLNLL